MRVSSLKENNIEARVIDFLKKQEDPHGAIYNLLTTKSPEGQWVSREYDSTAGENGLHGDDDFEEIIDRMVSDFGLDENIHETEADPKIVAKFAGVSDSQRSYYVMKWAEEQGIPTDKAMELAGYEKGDYMGAGAYNWRYVGDEDMYESEEKNYVCVHAKKGKYSCKATSSYGAAKKAAEHWGLKSTAGIDAHLADEKKTATESMLRSVVKELTEAEFDEAAGEKDPCYHKVKSRYKVWPSAYASGALVKCRKVGAANWGKSKK